MSGDNVNPYPHIPAEFQSLLLEFTIEFLMEKPNDILDFAVDYFMRIRDKRTANGGDLSGYGEEPPPPLTTATTDWDDSMLTDDEDEPMLALHHLDTSSSPTGENLQRPLFTMVEREGNSGESSRSSTCFSPLHHGNAELLELELKDFPNLTELPVAGNADGRPVCSPLAEAASVAGSSPSTPMHVRFFLAPPPTRSCGRRKSVFAEHYNPEEDDDDVAKVVFPKTDEQRQRLSEAVKDIFLFRSLDHEQMQEVLDAMFERTVSTNEFVIVQGDDGDNFYVIQSGTFEIYVILNDNEKKLVGKYENRGSFGELALLYNMPRAATIQAMTDGSLWALDRQTFRRILLKNAFKKRKMYEALLEKVPMLQQLEAYERMNLADALYPRTFEDGQLIIKQGDAADGMYFVEEGIVVCSILGEKESFEREISRINKGGYFGELALVTHKPRAASVYAAGRVKLAFLDVQAFERLLGPCMDIMKRNIDDYEEQIVKIFGSKTNLSFAR